jgi:hypothetical protein
VQRAGNLLRRADTGPGLLTRERLHGRVVEVSEPAALGALTAVCALMAEVMARGEPVAWVEAGPSVFFPPDLHFYGLDVEAIPVVWATDAKAALQAADWLVRSGAFGLVVIDGVNGPVDEGTLGRLARLADEADATVLFLTVKSAEQGSLGALVSLRVAVTREGELTNLTVVKDKRSGRVLQQKVHFDGPLGVY